MDNEMNRLIPELRFPEFARDGEWEGKKLEEVCEINPKASELPEQFVYIDLESVENGTLLQRKIIKREGAPSRAQRLLKENDIIFQMVRPYQKNNYYFLKKGNFEYVSSTGYAQLRSYISSPYLYQFIHTDIFVDNVLEKCTGSNYPAINSSDLSQISVLIPKIKEQQKIAACLSSLDELIAAHSQKLAALKDHKRGLMQNLFPQESETIPRLRFPEFAKDGAWEEKKLGEIAELTSSRRIHLADYVSIGIPFFRGKEISQLKRNKIPQDILYISKEQYNTIKEKYGVPGIGDILMTAVGTLANVYCVKNIDKFYFKDGNLIWMKNITIDSSFLEVLLDVEKGKILASAIGSSQKALTMTALNKLEFLIPTKNKEQQKIAECLSSLNELITAQSEKVEQLKLHKKGLMQGLFPKVQN